MNKIFDRYQEYDDRYEANYVIFLDGFFFLIDFFECCLLIIESNDIF